jgi:hypothetical protein
MLFPNSLLLKKRKTFDEKDILPEHFMYMRHKPGHDWKVGDEFPTYEKINMDQSFNWNVYSIPVWTRFNDQKVYSPEHGIMAYSVGTIKNISEYSADLPPNIVGIKHVPLEFNYSHCELYPNGFEPKAKTRKHKNLRRAIRHALTTDWKKKIDPYQKVSFWTNVKEYIKMLQVRRSFKKHIKKKRD